jgi:hypothetical protein
MDASNYNGSIKTKKHNIGIEEVPKIAIIGDYWDKEMIMQFVDLLKEYEELFPQRSSEMKEIAGSLGPMKIQYKLDAKLVKRMPYRLNPKYKVKVCKELDWMLDVGIIVPMEESFWISPMVVQPKNTSDIQICVDLRSLNIAYIHNPFPTPFKDEVLENVEGREAYTFTNIFFRVSSSSNHRGGSSQNHLCNRMGVLCIHCDAFCLKEFLHSFFRDSGHGL